MMKIQYFWILLVVLSFTACDSDDVLAEPLDDATTTTPITYTSGTADFSTFVALGNSLTAGFSDGSLFIEGQENSFPNIMANQFALANGGVFTQPLIDDNVGGLLLGGTLIAGPRLIFDTVGQTPVPFPDTPTTDITNIIAGPYNNMGVPGAKSFHLLAPGYGNIANLPAAANPYFVRMASTPDVTMLEDAMAMSPTFFSLWIGNNDVLGYATSGGDDSNPITDQATFDASLMAIVTTLTSGNAQGIMANIPSVTDAPFFTTVPFNAIPLDDATATLLNGGFTAYNNGLLAAEAALLIDADERAARTINFIAGNNAVTLEDEDLTNLSGLGLPNYRQATADDLLLLTSSSFLGTTVGGNPTLINGVSVPLADNWVLTPEEQILIADATIAFNQTISDLANQFELPLFDANAFLNEVATTGVTSGSVTITDDFVTGGGFSLDGIHPSPRGYAVAANEMISLINEKYGSNIPLVNPANYTGVYIQ